MKRLIGYSAVLLVLTISNAFAGKCVLSVTRVACPGQEKESYAKCGGKAACSEEPAADSEAACAKAGLDGCSNGRLTITKSKEITATFDGKPVLGGKQFCKADRPDFNGCK